jgi:hypothetical protein
MNEAEYHEPDCSKYRVKALSGNRWLVGSDIFGKTWPVNYSIEKKDRAYDVTLRLKFVHSREINFEERSSLWIRYSQDIWSVPGMRLIVVKVPVDYTGVSTAINVTPWPSSFYIKRVSSHEWSVLTSPRTAAHEVGHLLGLDDEYYEMDKRILDRNNNRYIGPRTSIMRNMLSGRPEKRHIHFLLSPIKCN